MSGIKSTGTIDAAHGFYVSGTPISAAAVVWEQGSFAQGAPTLVVEGGTLTGGGGSPVTLSISAAQPKIAAAAAEVLFGPSTLGGAPQPVTLGPDLTLSGTTLDLATNFVEYVAPSGGAAASITGRTLSISGGVEYGGTLYGTLAAGGGVTITPSGSVLAFSAGGGGSAYFIASNGTFTSSSPISIFGLNFSVYDYELVYEQDKAAGIGNLFLTFGTGTTTFSPITPSNLYETGTSTATGAGTTPYLSGAAIAIAYLGVANAGPVARVGITVSEITSPVSYLLEIHSAFWEWNFTVDGPLPAVPTALQITPVPGLTTGRYTLWARQR